MIDDHEFKIAVAAAIARHDSILAQLAEAVRVIGSHVVDLQVALSESGYLPELPREAEVQKPN